MASAADLKSLTYSRQNRVQGLQIESGTRIVDLLVPMTFRSPRKGVAAMVRGLRKVGARKPDRPRGQSGGRQRSNHVFGNEMPGDALSGLGTRASANTSGPDLTSAKVAWGETADMKRSAPCEEKPFLLPDPPSRNASASRRSDPAVDLMSRRHPLRRSNDRTCSAWISKPPAVQ